MLVRQWMFRISIAASGCAAVAIPFYERWFTKLGYAALASDKLHSWLYPMWIASAIAVLGASVGRGPYRAPVCIVGVFEFYFWFVVSIAV